jgi:PAS domain S-box-containing protein
VRDTNPPYRQLVELMHEGAVLTARDGTLLYANLRFADMAGSAVDRLVGMRLHELLSPPDVTASLLEADPVVSEAELVAAGGIRLPVRISATSVRNEDADVRCMIVSDVSQTSEHQTLLAERLTSQIIEQAAEGIVVCDHSGRIIRASNAARRLASSADELVPFERAFDLRDDSGRAISAELVRSAIEGVTVAGREVSLVHEPREPIALLLSIAPITASDNEVVGCVISFVDITVRKKEAIERSRLLDEANAARRDAETANAAKDEFLAMLGHELRNPLAPIVTALDLMELRHDPSSLRERQIIQRHIAHVSRLVDDLMDVARIARGKVELDKKRVDIAAVAQKAIEAASRLIEEREHRLIVELAEGLYVEGDETRLCQVISNLLTNAAKYTPKGGAIALHAHRDDGFVVITVRDNGVGIAPELLPMLFDRFVQGKQSLDRSEGGLGLGLSIVRSLTKLHGGTVEARSAGPGKGSEFELRFPPSVAEAQPVAAPEAIARPDGKRVLVVDDNEDAANMLADVLTMLGHEVATAYDGPSALELAPAFKPDIAILDIGLPVMDGYELAGCLRGIAGNASAKLVALTGYGSPSDRERTSAAGFDAHMVKPVSLAALTTTIDRLTAES